MKYLLATFVFIVGVFVGQLVVRNVSAESDHSECQYPIRWSNPKDGCDNSDPAVPQCMKVAYSQQSEKTCIDEFVKANTPEKPKPVRKPTEVHKEVKKIPPQSTCN